MGDDWNPGVVNYTKAAIVFANFVTTVSPQHAWEARYTDQGFGLGKVLFRHEDKFGGILNGLDYDVWNPETDPHIHARFAANSFEHKAQNTQALRERLWLRPSDGPLVAYVGRLDEQKGVHLIKHALDHSLRNGAQFVLLGSSADPAIDAEFRFVRHVFNDNPDCHLELRFDDPLAHQIYAGADLVVVPSLFEPCGLAQLIALRYGAVPIVRAVGGLRDSVADVDWSDRPIDERNGYVFDHPDFGGLESAMDRAFGLWRHDRDAFRRLARTGMRCDYSWKNPGQHYVNVYEHIRHR
jgi:starch synthase